MTGLSVGALGCVFYVHVCNFCFIGDSVVPVSTDSVNTSHSFYLGLGTFTVLATITDNYGASVEYIVENITTVIDTNIINSTQELFVAVTEFLDENLYSKDITSISQAASVVVSAISVLDYIGDSIESSTNDNSSNQTVTTTTTTNISLSDLKDARGEMIDYLIDYLFPNLTQEYNSDQTAFLETKTEILSVIVGEPTQIGTESGETVITEFAIIMDELTSLESDTLFESSINDDTADALVSGIVNIGLAFAYEYNISNSTVDEGRRRSIRRRRRLPTTNAPNTLDSGTTAKVTQLALDLLMVVKLNGTLTDDVGYYYNRNGVVVDAVRKSTENIHIDTGCGQGFIEYHQIGTLLDEQGVSEINCLFTSQPWQIYQNIPAQGDILSNVISLELAIVNDSNSFSVQELITDVLNGNNTDNRRRLQFTDESESPYQTVTIDNATGCQVFVFVMKHETDASDNLTDTESLNAEEFASDMDFTNSNIHSITSSARTITVAECRYYNPINSTFETDGCFAVFSNETLTKCVCIHLTAFAVSTADFNPTINIISQQELNSVTLENIGKHPTALVGIIGILFMFWLIIICLPRINDKPIVSQMRPWSVLQQKKWNHTYVKYYSNCVWNCEILVKLYIHIHIAMIVNWMKLLSTPIIIIGLSNS